MSIKQHILYFYSAMRLLLLFLLFCVSLNASEPLKVATWNLDSILGGANASPSQSLNKMHQAQIAIRAINPDILCLQGIQNWNTAMQLVSVLPGYSVCVVSNFDDEQQLVIASRFPADAAWSKNWISSDKLTLSRGYAFAAIRLPENRLVLTYSLHMKADGQEKANEIAERETSARQLHSHVEAMRAVFNYSSNIVVLAGDWNTTLDNDPKFDKETTIRSFLDRGFQSTWWDVPFKKRITRSGTDKFSSGTFDYILIKGLVDQMATCWSFPSISVHNPVVVNIQPDGGSPPLLAPLPNLTPTTVSGSAR